MMPNIYNIQHINNYHSQFKNFMSQFKSVSTKYLNNYLIWHNFANFAKEINSEKKNILFMFAFTTLKYEKYRQVSQRPAIPLVS